MSVWKRSQLWKCCLDLKWVNVRGELLRGLSLGKCLWGEKTLKELQVSQMPVRKMPVGKMPVGKMPVGKMPVGKMPVGKMPVRELSVGYENFYLSLFLYLCVNLFLSFLSLSPSHYLVTFSVTILDFFETSFQQIFLQ